MKPRRPALAAAESPARLDDPATVASVDYRMARDATVRAFKDKQLGRQEICDAQRELRRNAEFCGAPTDRDCPVCAAEGLVEVTYAFGPYLPKHGRCVTTLKEMQRLQQRRRTATGYVVEVCLECGWNHLIRRYTIGGSKAG
ncbi:MAG: DUF5318 family protein [Acidimicrobiaceae bacterium]|nr:DUF5318 family protein [Acidimicrobiaceae bacterium]MCY4279366.1 DUF5318 family protein [Acidimicrobiaceae bacterium]MCY4294447.1 DUF5318 family protein [Acidimicrobiaceae bacterium]